jgi:glycosyltransferase involved in cell wall biosynthesis
MPIMDPGLRSAIARLLADGKFDIVHAHDWTVASVIGPARHAGVPVVLTQHEYSHVCATKRLMRGGRDVCPGPTPVACLRCASSWYGPVVGPGVAVANALARRTRNRRVNAFIPVSSVVAIETGLPGHSPHKIITNFIPDEIVENEPLPTPDGPIVFVGLLSRDKGVDVLIEAHRLLGGVRRLVLAGRVLDDQILDLSDEIDLRGPLDHPSVMDLMRTASVVVVHSTFRDPCPTVVLEAMAVGRPIVAAASGGIIDMVEDGVTGLLVPPGDPVALARALSTVLDDPERATAMGHVGNTRVRWFAASAVMARIEEVYAGLSAGRPPPA